MVGVFPDLDRFEPLVGLNGLRGVTFERRTSTSSTSEQIGHRLVSSVNGSNGSLRRRNVEV